MEKVTKHGNRLSRDGVESSALEMCEDKSMWHLQTWPSEDLAVLFAVRLSDPNHFLPKWFYDWFGRKVKYFQIEVFFIVLLFYPGNFHTTWILTMFTVSLRDRVNFFPVALCCYVYTGDQNSAEKTPLFYLGNWYLVYKFPYIYKYSSKIVCLRKWIVKNVKYCRRMFQEIFPPSLSEIFKRWRWKWMQLYWKKCLQAGTGKHQCHLWQTVPSHSKLLLP